LLLFAALANRAKRIAAAVAAGMPAFELDYYSRRGTTFSVFVKFFEKADF